MNHDKCGETVGLYGRTWRCRRKKDHDGKHIAVDRPEPGLLAPVSLRFHVQVSWWRR